MMGHGAGVLGFIMVLFIVALSIFLLVKDKKDKKVYFNDMTEGFGNDIIDGSNPGMIIMLITGPLMLIAVVFIGFYPKKS